MAEVLARGPNFVYAREFILARHGEDSWQRILEALPVDAKKTWAEPLLVTGTYPFQAFKDMLAALAQVMGVVSSDETARMYEHIADRSLTTVHKFFFRFAEPSFVIKRYPMLWERFFVAGRVEVPVAERGRAVLEFELPEIFLDWLSPACAGYSKRAVELAGGSDFALSQTESRHLGDGLYRLTYALTWKE